MGADLRKECLAGLFIVLGAHALAYFLLNLLPDAATIALGLEAAKQDVLSSFQSAMPKRTYIETLAGLMRLDLGRTLDAVPVYDELRRALALSAPRVSFAFLIVCAVAVTVAFVSRIPRRLFSFLSFLPPYVSAFIAVLLLLLFGAASPGDPALGVACTLAVALSPAMLVAEQAATVTARNLATEYARNLVALGANNAFVRRSLLANLLAELAPSLEKVLVLIAASLLFAEPILGLPGLGTAAVRAVRRADADLVMGVTLVFALGVSIARVAAVGVRARFGLRA